jgi:hypothetical protein
MPQHVVAWLVLVALIVAVVAVALAAILDARRKK